MTTVKVLLAVAIFIISSCGTKRFSGPCDIKGKELSGYIMSDVDRNIRGGTPNMEVIFDTLNYQVSVLSFHSSHTRQSVLFIKHDKNCYYFNDRKFGKSKPLIHTMINEYSAVTGKAINIDSLHAVIARKMEAFTVSF